MTALATLIKQACEDSGEVDFRDDYSGRGMYGDRCVGITGTRGQCMSVIGAAIKRAGDDGIGHNFEKAVDKLMGFSQDSMGLDIIMYWPSIKSVDE